MANEPNPTGRRGIAHQFQHWAGPLPVRAALPPRPPTMVYPEVLRGRAKRAHEFPFLSKRPIPVVSLFPAAGPGGVATFFLSLESGAKIVYGWSTTIYQTYSGAEQRESLLNMPRRRIEGVAFLRDSVSRDARGLLMRFAATGATFLMGLTFEELTLVSNSAGTVVNVGTTTLSDWILPGQRAMLVSPDGTGLSVVVQSSTATTISLDVAPGTTGRAGARIMPLIPVVFDSQQGFSRYPVGVDLWTIRAQAVSPGYSGTQRMGTGATVTTFTDGSGIPFANITDDDLLIWDRPNLIEGTASEVMLSGTELLDKGVMPSVIGGANTPEWSRSLKFRSAAPDDWAWLKAFLWHARGRQVPWLLSTNRPDLSYVATVSGGIKVLSWTTPGGGDYQSWFASTAHRRLAITAGGSVGYFEVLEVTDNLDGTLTLSLDVPVTGTVTKISLLEQVRFARDEIEVTMRGPVRSIDETVIVVRDAIDVASRFIFDRVVTQHFSYTGIPPDLPPTTQPFIIPAGGRSYLFNYTSDRTLGFGGIQIGNGSIEATDGMVFCLANNNTASFSGTCNHEDSGMATLVRRFRNAGLGSAGGAGKSVMYRYNGTVQRWIQIM